MEKEMPPVTSQINQHFDLLENDVEMAEIIEPDPTTKNSSEKPASLIFLIEENKKLKRKIQLQEKAMKKYKNSFIGQNKKFNRLKKNICKYLRPDQIRFMCGMKPRWTIETIQRGLMLRHKLGRTFYENTFRKDYAPFWPSATTCSEAIKKFKLRAGILKFNVNVLGAKYEKIPENNRRIGLIFDEKSIVPSQQRDYNINEYRGKVTLLPSEGVRKKEGNEPLAKNALVVLAVGMSIRDKEICGLHYTAGCTDGEAQKNFICSLIKYIENNTPCKVDFIGFDLSPTNQMMLNAFGIFLTQTNSSFKVAHPNRPEDDLYLQYDPAHGEKNFVCAFRNGDIEISMRIVEEHNLNSKKACFSEIKKVFNVQKNLELQPAKKLKQEHVTPSQYEKMKQHIASEVFSNEVSSAIEFMDKKAVRNGKKNSTAWLLNILLRFHNIIFDTEGWQSDNKEKFKKDKIFLIWMADIFLPNLRFKNALRSIPGLIISIRTMIELTEKYFELGFSKVVPAFFLNDAIENIFSIVGSIIQKPTAVSMANALRIISLRQFQFNPIKGNYGWDPTEPIKINFIGLLKLFAESEETVAELDSEENETIPIIQVLDEITPGMLFDTPLEFNTFYCQVTKFMNTLFNSFDCKKCKIDFVDKSESSTFGAELFAIRQQTAIETHDKEYAIEKLSRDVMIFLMRLEFLYQELKKIIPIDCEKFERIFLINAERLFFPNEHCMKITKKIIEKFIKERRKQALHKYFLHKSNTFASKSLI